VQLTCILLKEIVTFENIQNEQVERFGVGSVFLPLLTKLTTAKMLSDDLSAKRHTCNSFCSRPYCKTSRPFPEDTLEEAGITVMVVTARSSAKACLIADMLPFVHTFTVGAVSFSAVGFSDIFVT